jgi:DNA-binding response OmpR family regulator
MTAPGRKTILLLDDSRIVLDMLEAALQTHEFIVRAAETLSELELALQKGKPDLFVLDVQMPEAFGDDVGQVLREIRKLNAPIILFSALDEETLAQRALDAGLDGYVSKDAGIDALVQRIEEMVGSTK